MTRAVPAEPIRDEDMEGIEAVVQWLARLHALTPSSAWGHEERNLALGAVKRQVRQRNIGEIQRSLALDVLGGVSSWRGTDVMLHGDPRLENFGLVDGRAVGFDFEFCCRGAAGLDLGMLIASYVIGQNFNPAAPSS